MKQVMKISMGDRILVQSGEYVREVAKVKFIHDNGLYSLRMADGHLVEVKAKYILKNFSQNDR